MPEGLEAMPRTSDADQRLMEAAAKLIWEHSYGATSVDDICAAAGVKKGSFYHFFTSKSELAVTAIEADWERRKPNLDQIFSSTVPPLERIVSYFEFVAKRQEALHAECGSVLGCPLFSLGSELGTLDRAISEKVREILDRYVKYFESAVRDADADGIIVAPDAATKARMLFALFQGTLAQARIRNDPALLRGMAEDGMQMLGVPAQGRALA